MNSSLLLCRLPRGEDDHLGSLQEVCLENDRLPEAFKRYIALSYRIGTTVYVFCSV